jgi:hypothetical protein
MREVITLGMFREGKSDSFIIKNPFVFNVGNADEDYWLKR